jgi:hypothetical protein
MANVADPKFVPAAASLSKVGMKVGDIRTDEALIAFVLKGQENRALSEAQEAVAVYTARKRGHEFDWIMSNLKISKDVAERREIEGMALLRLQVDEAEVPRVQSAIRTGRLGIKVVDDITAKSYTVTDGGVDARLEDLEILSAGKRIKDKYVLADKGMAISDKQAADIVKHARTVVEQKVEPVSASSILQAVPNFSEEVGLKVKEGKRTTSGSKNDGPHALEFHLKAAMKDIAALEKAADQKYELTAHDYKALFDLCSMFDLVIEPTEAMVKALETLEKASK